MPLPARGVYVSVMMRFGFRFGFGLLGTFSGPAGSSAGPEGSGEPESGSRFFFALPGTVDRGSSGTSVRMFTSTSLARTVLLKNWSSAVSDRAAGSTSGSLRRQVLYRHAACGGLYRPLLCRGGAPGNLAVGAGN